MIQNPSNEQGTEELVPPTYLSPSSIETFRQCPLKFKYSKIDRIQDPPTEATTLGSFVHAVLEDLFRLSSSERSIHSARPLMANQWNSEWQDKTHEVLRGNEQAMKDFRWRAWWCIENYFAMEDPTSFDVSGIEHELNGNISGTDVPVRGFIDRWHMSPEGIVISDYKTGKTPSKRFQDGKFFQLLVYADLLGSQQGSAITDIELLYLKDGVRLRRKVDETEVDSMREVVVQVHKAVHDRCGQGHFEPTVNRLCDWCSYKPMCPAWK